MLNSYGLYVVMRGRIVSQDYTNMEVSDLFNYTKPESIEIKRSAAESWVEAENLFMIRKRIIEWFNLMEEGKAEDRKPDPFAKKKITPEKAEKFCKELDEDFDIEVQQRGDWLRGGVDSPPGFSDRLSISAKIAFVQDIKALLKTPAQIRREAVKRTKAGEVLPPEAWFDQFKAKGYCSRICPSPKFCPLKEKHDGIIGSGFLYSMGDSFMS